MVDELEEREGREVFCCRKIIARRYTHDRAAPYGSLLQVFFCCCSPARKADSLKRGNNGQAKDIVRIGGRKPAGRWDIRLLFTTEGNLCVCASLSWLHNSVRVS